MRQEKITIEVSITFDPAKKNIEFAFKSEEDAENAIAKLSKLIRVRSSDGSNVLENIDVKTLKVSPAEQQVDSLVRPMWTLTTCDIIK